MSEAFIVKRKFDTNDGDAMLYVKVDRPYPHETVYHGDFTYKVIKIGMFELGKIVTYVPTDESKLTSKTYDGIEKF